MRKDCPQDLLAPYLLGALEPNERGIVQAHLEGCASCRAQVHALNPAVELLLYTVPVQTPSPELKARVQRHISELVARDMPMGRPQPLPRKLLFFPVPLGWTRGAALAATFVSLVVLALAAGAFLLLGQVPSPPKGDISERELAGLLASPATVLRELQGTSIAPGASGMVLTDPERSAALVVVYGLPLPKEDHVYQVWLIRNDQRISGGTFRVDREGAGYLALQVSEKLAFYQALGITQEPAGGSVAPTTPRLLGGTLH